MRFTGSQFRLELSGICWRPMQGLRNVHHTIIRRTRSPSHPGGSLMAGARG